MSFISSVAMELTSTGTHGAGGLEAVQGFIQDYQLLVLQDGESDMLQYFSIILSQAHSQFLNNAHSCFSVKSREWIPYAHFRNLV
jgi:hypothetical protein